MEEAHSIHWIYLQTDRGGHRRKLSPGEKPEASFWLTDGEKAIATFAWCNLHGLWMTEIQ